ncbi:hypothetical protein ACN9JG_06840 [Cereibacter azotoformans]|uniref:hypothetical protein n=1 Tax=Cereibacter azotoformans TaxID=43057 RepID=UPI003B2117E4
MEIAARKVTDIFCQNGADIVLLSIFRPDEARGFVGVRILLGHQKKYRRRDRRVNAIPIHDGNRPGSISLSEVLRQNLMRRAGNECRRSAVAGVAPNRDHDLIGVGNAGERPFAVSGAVTRRIFNAFDASHSAGSQFCILRCKQLRQLGRILYRPSGICTG